MTADQRAAYIRALVDAAPPITAEQRERIQVLLRRPDDDDSEPRAA